MDKPRRGAPLPADLAARIPTVNRIGTVKALAGDGGAVELLLFGEVGWDITALGVRRALQTAGKSAAITARINSDGGFVFEGFAIYNALAQHDGQITVIVESVAASMAAFIAMAADRIVMPTNSFMMIHNPWGLVIGEASDMRETADLLDKLRAPQIATFAARTGQSEADIVAMLDATTWMSADEAKALGFADETQDAIEALAHIDPHKFTGMPAALAARASATRQAPRAEPPQSAIPARETPATPPRSPVMDPVAQAGNQPAPVITPVITPPVAAAPVTATLAQLQAIAARGKLDSDWIVAQLAGGATENAARDAALDALAARASAPIAGHPAREIEAESDKKYAMMANAIANRANPKVALDAGAREFRGMSLADIAAECLRDAGVKTRGMTRMELAQAALTRNHQFRGAAGAHSTSDFPNLLANTASKSLRDAYMEAPRTFMTWTRQQNLPDFKDFKAIALNAAPSLAQIREDGEVTYGTIGEGAETWRLLRYGKAIAITYVAIVNDDLSGFTRIPAMFANAAARLESDIVYGVLLANAALADTVALFHTTHANLVSGAGTVLTADATGVANIGVLAGKLAKQTAPGPSSPLNLIGRYLLVPPSLDPIARVLWSGGLNPTSFAAVNPYAGAYQPIVEARLELGANGSSGSATAYYLVADPSQIDTLVWGHLEGEDGPQIKQDVDFDTDGVSIKVTHNFGAKAIDYRGMAKSAGA